jgi:hypothetical protein
MLQSFQRLLTFSKHLEIFKKAFFETPDFNKLSLELTSESLLKSEASKIRKREITSKALGV